MERNRALRNILLVGLGLIALVLVMSTPGMLGIGTPPEVKLYAEKHVVPLDGPSAHSLLESHKGNTTLFFLYASWCPFCKKQFNMLHALQTRYPDALKIEYISLDEDKEALSEFLLNTYPNKPFTPYHVAINEDRLSFDSMVTKKGFSADGRVPHLLLFAPDGSAAKEFKGLTPIPNLLDAIKEVM